jgi:Lar family restriction alleviation protein
MTERSMTDEQLVPCPCCGSADTLVVCWPISIAPWQVYRSRCKDCELRTADFNTHIEAIAAWNRRAPLPGAEALADAVWQLLDDMGADGLSVCGAAKAQARIAVEPFLSCEDSDELDFTLRRAQEIMEAIRDDA